MIREKRSSVAATVPARPLVPVDLEVDAELLAWRYQKPQSPFMSQRIDAWRVGATKTVAATVPLGA